MIANAQKHFLAPLVRTRGVMRANAPLPLSAMCPVRSLSWNNEQKRLSGVRLNANNSVSYDENATKKAKPSKAAVSKVEQNDVDQVKEKSAAAKSNVFRLTTSSGAGITFATKKQ